MIPKVAAPALYVEAANQFELRDHISSPLPSLFPSPPPKSIYHRPSSCSNKQFFSLLLLFFHFLHILPHPSFLSLIFELFFTLHKFLSSLLLLLQYYSTFRLTFFIVQCIYSYVQYILILPTPSLLSWISNNFGQKVKSGLSSLYVLPLSTVLQVYYIHFLLLSEQK